MHQQSFVCLKYGAVLKILGDKSDFYYVTHEKMFWGFLFMFLGEWNIMFLQLSADSPLWEERRDRTAHGFC